MSLAIGGNDIFNLLATDKEKIELVERKLNRLVRFLAGFLSNVALFLKTSPL